MTSRISRLPSFPSPLSPLSSSKPYKLRFSISTCRVTRIFFNEFKHRRSHRSISILIRRVYNGATSKENREIVSGLATRHDFLFFFFFTTIDRKVVEICKLVYTGKGGEKNSYFSAWRSRIQNWRVFLFFSFLFFFFQCCSLLIKRVKWSLFRKIIYEMKT